MSSHATGDGGAAGAVPGAVPVTLVAVHVPDGVAASVERFARVIANDVATLDTPEVSQMLRDISALTRVLHGREVDCNLRLRDLAVHQPGLVPEFVNAAATNRSTGTAARALERADTATLTPTLKASLDRGALSADHLDAFAAAVRALEPSLRPLLLAKEPELTRRAIALHATVEQFRTWIRREVRLLDDGRTRLARQQHATHARVWTNPHTGMVHFTGALDPLNGAVFHQRLADQLETRFHQSRPAECPTDPLAAHDWLRAHALVDLVRGDVTGAGKPEMIVVIDHTTLTTGPHRHSRVDAGPGIELPHATVLDIAGRARLVPVVVNTDGVVISQGHPVDRIDQLAASLTRPVDLDHHRDRRQASTHQRRALRAMYPRCAIPGCNRHVMATEAHHIREWDRGGPTDLHNLLPLCRHHHDHAHQHRWQLTLHPNRALTIATRPNHPDNITLTTGPPRTLWDG